MIDRGNITSKTRLEDCSTPIPSAVSFRGAKWLLEINFEKSPIFVGAETPLSPSRC